jgi:hypothetical protein
LIGVGCVSELNSDEQQSSEALTGLPAKTLLYLLLEDEEVNAPKRG